MKIFFLTLMVLLSSEGVIARASLAMRVVESTKALALSAVLLAAPLDGAVADVSKHTYPSELAADFLRVGMAAGWSSLDKDDVAGGLTLGTGMRQYPHKAGGLSFAADVKMLMGQAESYVIDGELVFGLDAFDFTQETIAPLVFIDSTLGVYGARDNDDRSVLILPALGVGLEFLDDFLGFGRHTSVQLRAGLGFLDQHHIYNDDYFGKFSALPMQPIPTYRKSSATRERSRLAQLRFNTPLIIATYDGQDIDAVGTLKLIVRTDGNTIGSVLNKNHNSFWHWLKIVPNAKIIAALHKPIFDEDERHSGDIIYSLQAQLGIIGNLYLVLEHADSPNFRDPYQKATVRFDFFSAP